MSKNTEAKTMSGKIFVWLLVTVLLTAVSPARAQQRTKIPVIGRLLVSASAEAARIEAFRQGLRELGYVEGKSVAIEHRFAEGKLDRFPVLARDLVSLKVDIIVTGGGLSTRAAKEATSGIPIVMTNDSDPVGAGTVAGLAQPGGNITGLSTLAPELGGNRLEILKEVVPKLSRVAVLGTSTTPGYAQVIKEIELAAKALGVKLQYLDVLDSSNIEPAFRAAAKEHAQGILTISSPILFSQRAQVVGLAVKNQLPAIYSIGLFVDDGGLMYYGVDLLDLDRRAATFVDKILKGRTPADLPVEQPMRFEFVVSLPAAKKIGLTVPPNVLVRANRVIR